MICPECGKKFAKAPENSEEVSTNCQHLWGLCRSCGELVHVVYFPMEDRVYAWTGQGEAKYANLFNVLNGCEHVLYISELEENLVKLCREFAKEHNWNAGFVLSESMGVKAKIVAKVHKAVLLPEVLFSEHPSFVAERLILLHVTGKLYSFNETATTKFEKWEMS